MKREMVAVEDGEGYFDEDYGYDNYSSYAGGGGYSYGGPEGEGGHMCQLCGKSYKSAGSLKNHRSLYHRSEIGKNRNVAGINAADMGEGSLALDDFSLDQI